jgi:Resolvase, N terminal domain
MTKAVKRAAIYTRVSTDSQTIENQLRELPQVAERRGWEVVEVYNDAGISGAKVRAPSPCGESSTDLRFPPEPLSERRSRCSSLGVAR